MTSGVQHKTYSIISQNLKKNLN